jgi:O-antigen/teichoic acid export membrane protein
VAIAAGLAEAGLVTVGTREYSVRQGADREAMLANLQGIRIALGFGGVAVGVLFGLAAGYDSVMLAGVALTGVGVVLAAVQATVGIPLAAGLRWGSMTALELLRQVAQVIGFLALVAAGASLLPFFVVPIPVGLIVLVATVVLVRRAAPPVMPAFDRERWGGLLKLVAPYAAATAVGSVYVYVAAVLMELVATPDEVGWFAASFRVFIVLGGIPALLVGAFLPILARAAKSDRERHAYGTERLITTSIIGGVWLALMTALLAKLAIDVVAGSDFAESVPVLRIQAIALLASFLLAAATQVLITDERYRALLVVSTGALLISAVLTLALAPGTGAQGAAIASVLGESLAAVLAVWFVVRTQPELHIPWGTVAKVALAAAAAGALALLPVPAVAIAVLATIVYGGVLLLLRAVPGELLDLVPFLRR